MKKVSNILHVLWLMIDSLGHGLALLPSELSGDRSVASSVRASATSWTRRERSTVPGKEKHVSQP